MASMDRQQEFVLRTLEERDIRFVRLWFTDVTGYLKAVAVAPAEIEAAFAEGIGFDGSAIEGFARVYESDMLAKPDPGTFQVMPSAKGQPSDTARMFCDITLPDGSPAWADPRHVLRRSLAKAAEMGFTFYTPPEIEFFLLKDLPTDGTPPTPADTGGYFDLSTHNVAHDFRREAVFALEAMGISVEFSHHEVAPGQQEIDLRYADALSMAEPSKPMPSSNAPSSSAGATATDFSVPSTSVNHSRTKRIWRSSSVCSTNSCWRSTAPQSGLVLLPAGYRAVQCSALPRCQVAHDTDQSPFCHTCRAGPPDCTTSTTSPMSAVL
jgi:hypothetical protein